MKRGLRRARGGGGVRPVMRMNRTANVDLEGLLHQKNQPPTRVNPRSRVMTMLHEPGDVVNPRRGKHRRNSTVFQRGKRRSPVWMYVLQERTIQSEDEEAAVVVVAVAVETEAVAAAVEVAVADDHRKVAQEPAVAADDHRKVAQEPVVAVGDHRKVAHETAVAVGDHRKVAHETVVAAGDRGTVVVIDRTVYLFS